MHERIHNHPCYCVEASFHYARIHVAVARRCNIQCNYCNRRYDCANENRPGVTSGLLSPDAAYSRVQAALSKIPQLTVVGVAGPGDPLADPQQTFQTFKLIGAAFPHLELCLATNGLALPDHLDDLTAHRVGYVTITINAIDPTISQEIYAWVRHRGVIYHGKEAAAILWSQQQAGLEGLVERDILVKVNTVLIPGINDQHIPEIARKVKSMGAYIFNVIPLIPIAGTVLANHRAPSWVERRDVVQACAPYIRVMRHCCQCRSDAVGLLDQDRSAEFNRPIQPGLCGSPDEI